ncbi:MAG TPA: DUF2239 family protein [Anaeromyxobacter sp.]|nr:DUF2239 family protein [Anaeromyxobacter sp.]
MEAEPTYIAFAGARRVGEGAIEDVLRVLKQRFDRDRSDLVLVFDVESGQQVDFDLRGTLDEVLDRETRRLRRGPGRPKLGVTSREVTLLPRHWDWLEQQRSGASAALRRLVEQALKFRPDAERARRIRTALGAFLSAMAGDRPGYEEASRALFAGDLATFEAFARRWPKDIREHALARAHAADVAQKASLADLAPPEVLVGQLYGLVWSEGDEAAIDRLVASRYVIHSDPGDPWDGQTLSRDGYVRRLRYSRSAFPDLRFTVHDCVAAGGRVAVRWSAQGTHAGELPGLPPTRRRLTFAGQTIYELRDGRVAGHWQVIDRLGFIQDAQGQST